MSLDLDRFFRGIWLANGALLLIMLLGGLGLGVYGLLSGLWGREERGVQAISTGAPPAEAVRPRAVRYGEPQRLLNSRWMLVQVHYGTDYAKSSGRSMTLASGAYERRYDVGGPLVNVMFLPPDSGPGRLLLDRPAYIRDLEFPAERPRYANEQIDSVPWIAYAVAFEDTDHSGRLDHEDAVELYLSDLDGGNFRRVLPAGLRVSSTQVLPNQQLLVSALDARGADGELEDQLPQRAFRFNPETNELTSDAAIDSLATSAGRILGRPGGSGRR